MPTVNKVTETLFETIKTELEHVDPLTAAQVNHLSVKTILQIKGSKDFADYEAQKKAQHPASTKPSINDLLIEVNRKLDILVKEDKEPRLL